MPRGSAAVGRLRMECTIAMSMPSTVLKEWISGFDAARLSLHAMENGDECRRHIVCRLADETLLLERNAQISASYAALYLRHETLFKWCGMAAFASQHIRKLLRLRASSETDQNSARALAGLISLQEVETIRIINNAIHDDIFWAHLVYDGCEEGLARLRAMTLGTTYEPLAAGFALIEEGRQLLDQSPERGAELIWKGNIALLRHEQEAVVQPFLSRLSCMFARVFSLGSSLNYEPRGVIDCMRYCSSFYVYMLMRGSSVLLRSRTLPRLDILDQRWRWIERVLVPKFRRLERDSAAAKLVRIVESGGRLWLVDQTTSSGSS